LNIKWSANSIVGLRNQTIGGRWYGRINLNECCTVVANYGRKYEVESVDTTITEQIPQNGLAISFESKNFIIFFSIKF